jgi:hypothetical protein
MPHPGAAQLAPGHIVPPDGRTALTRRPRVLLTARPRQEARLTGTGPRSLASSVLLSALVVCGHCLAKGKRTTVTARVDKRYADTSWYICGVKLRQRGQDCDLPRVASWLLEETVITSLLSSVLTPEYLRQSLEDAQHAVNERRPSLDVEIGMLEREAADKEAAVRGLLQLIQKQGLSPLLEDEYQRVNQAWSLLTVRLANAKQEAGQHESPQLTQDEIEAYITDMRGVSQTGATADRQELLRRFIRSIVLYPNHVEIAYNFGLSALAPLGNFGVPRSPLDGAPRATRTPAPGSGGRCSIR